MIRYKRFLLLLAFFVLGLTSLDYSMALAHTNDHQAAAVQSAQLEPEELDCPEAPRHRRKLHFVVAHSISISETGTLCGSSSPQNLLPIVYAGQCPTESLLVSWLDKREEHIRALKTEPLWLRYNVLLI
jgi:hypothetical protein